MRARRRTPGVAVSGERRKATTEITTSGRFAATTAATASSVVLFPDRDGPVTSRCSPSCRRTPTGPSELSPTPSGTVHAESSNTSMPSTCVVLTSSGSTPIAGGRCSAATGPSFSARAATAEASPSSPGRASCTSSRDPTSIARPGPSLGTSRGEMPKKLKSCVSPRRKASFWVPRLEMADGTVAGRSAVATTMIPSPGPSATRRAS